MVRGWLLVVIAACGDNNRTSPDDATTSTGPDMAAAADAAAVVDSTAVVDSSADSPADSAPDAPLPPSCAPLIDVSPRRLSNLALSGQTLYTSAYNVNAQDEVSDVTVIAIDLATETEAAPPVTMSGAVTLWEGQDASGDVYVSEFLAGTIWRFHPGTSPTPIVTGRPKPGIVTAEGGYLYWSEYSTTVGAPGLIQRRLLTGGPIEFVMDCDRPLGLVVVGDQVYCGTQYLQHAPKAGGGPVTGISYLHEYYITSMMEDGGSLYFVNMFNNPELYRVTLPNGPAVVVDQLSTFGRYTGLAMTSDSYLTVDNFTGVRRIDRTTGATVRIHDAIGDQYDPLIWNNQLYFVASTQTSITPVILHCGI